MLCRMRSLAEGKVKTNTKGVLTRNTKVCVVRPNFVSYDRILCRTIEFCVVQSNFVSYDRILCCWTT
jgi:hypothetical protein